MKKFLSLVLALVMTMSLFTISAGATEYKDLTDKDKIQYPEAVAVLNKLGIITGYEDGSFNPTGSLTRGAAAKIIVSLMIGSDAASSLTAAVAPYTDVPVTNTFAAYISYCKTAGYISGYSDGTFRPATELTGYAFAKMLLGALGYKSDVEKFTGDGWTMNVASVGSVAGLFKDVSSFNGNTAITREVACKLALNTLKATEVEYKGNNINVTTGAANVSITNQNHTNVENNSNSDYDLSVSSGTQFDTMQFCEQHFPTLKLNNAATDNMMRLSNQWTYQGAVVGKYARTANVTFTAETKEAAVKTALNGLTWGTATVYINGSEQTGTIKTNAALAALTGNGVDVEVFTASSSSAVINRVVVVNSVLAKVTSVNTSKSEITVKTVAAATTFGASAISLTTDVGYSKFVKNDYVVVTPYTSSPSTTALTAAYSVDSIVAATKVTGNATAKSTSDKTVTVAGTAYKQAANVDTANTVAKIAVSTSKTATLYLDSYGYFLQATGASDTDVNVMMIQSKYQALNADNELVYMVKGTNAAGTSVSVQVADVAASNAVAKGDVVKYAKASGNDYYTLTPEMLGNGGTATTTDDGTYIHIVAGSAATTGAGVTSFAASASKIPGTTNYFASDVVFVFGDSTTNPSVYTAVKKVAVSTDYVYITNSAGDVTAVFVNTANSNSASASSDVLFVNGTSTGTSTDNGTTYYAYNAYVDGAVQASFASKNNTVSNGFYLVSGKDSTTGYYTLNGTTSYSANTGDYATVVDKTFTSIVNSRYATIGGTEYDLKNATIVDTRPGVSDASKVDSTDELTAGMIVSVMYDADNFAASYVYVTGVTTVYSGITATKGTATSITKTDDNYALVASAASQTATLTFVDLPDGCTVSAVSGTTATATVGCATNVVTLTTVANGTTAVTVTIKDASSHTVATYVANVTVSGIA